jgi:uncharacterized damage-inducible protein DinB
MTTRMDSSDLIDTLEQVVELHLQEAIRIFQNMDEQQLLQPSVTGGWSIAQCLWHLNSYGHFYLPHIRKGLEGKATHNPVFKSSVIGAYFTKMMLPRENGRKYKAFGQHIPPEQPDAYSVIAEFIHQQESLLFYLNQSRQHDLNAIYIPVSISRWVKLKLGDTFQFLVTHNERHVKQAMRNA